ncbi:MAG TPA: MATE family efflux transporter [Candidatus Binatia bacterium]|nr:MATE family efflux transporter [Candidatus Binatia bacterium]
MRFPSRAGLREILRLALPIIASMASATVMGFIDTWMVALVGTTEVAAAMPAGIVAYTLTALPLGIAQCVSTFTAQALGRGTPEEGSAFAWQGLYLSVAVGVVCFVLWPAAPGFFSLFGHEPEVVALEVVYFRIRLWAVGVGVAVGALNGFFYGIHRPLIPSIAMVVDNVVNVLLCYVLIFGKLGVPALGLTGAALAFVLSYAVQLTVLLWAFLSDVVHRQFATRTAWQWAWPRFRQLVHIGWPAGMQSAVDVLGWGVLIVLMVGRFGKEQLAASNITIQYMTISFMPGIGLAQALTALVGRYIGEGRVELAIQRVHETLCLALSYMALMAVLYWTCRAPFIAFFNADPVVVRAGSNILLCAAFFQVFDGMGYTFAGALRGAGDTHWTAGITVALLLGVFAPLSLGMVTFTDLQSLGPWLAGTAYVILLGLSLWWRFAQGKWREIDIFAAREREKAVVVPSREAAG